LKTDGRTHPDERSETGISFLSSDISGACELKTDGRTHPDAPKEQIVRFHVFVSEIVKTSKSPAITWIHETRPKIYQIETPGYLHSNEKGNSYNIDYQS
jgi:hypothetical protein